VRKAIGDCQSFLRFQDKLLFTCQCTDARGIPIATPLVSAAACKVESKRSVLATTPLNADMPRLSKPGRILAETLVNAVTAT